ncbi:MAG: glutathione S-transferase family protein [Bacteriovoracaceae bacterium]
MRYTIYGSETSPFVRRLRLFLQNKKIPSTLKMINYLEKNDAEILKKINPINKIPVLKDEKNGQVVFDSRIIFNYILAQESLNKLTIDEENILSLIDGMQDSTVNLFMIKRSGIDITIDNSFFNRQRNRVEEILNHLTPWVESNPEWNYLTMSLYSLLDWGQFREMLNLKNRKAYLDFFQAHSNREEVLKTKIIVPA